jgi:hypothetical protein
MTRRDPLSMGRLASACGGLTLPVAIPAFAAQGEAPIRSSAQSIHRGLLSRNGCARYKGWSHRRDIDGVAHVLRLGSVDFQRGADDAS